MAHLISVIGVSGVGKTSLVRALNTTNQFALGLESHAERPFQTLFKEDPQYCFANQIDFLLFRAEQELSLRADPRPGLMDGGLELDFHGFTRLFHAHGWLTQQEFEIIKRFHNFIRNHLPPPDLFIHLTASQETIQSRLAARARINIAAASDAILVSSYLDDWMNSVPHEKILHLDVTNEPPDFNRSLPIIFEHIGKLQAM